MAQKKALRLQQKKIAHFVSHIHPDYANLFFDL